MTPSTLSTGQHAVLADRIGDAQGRGMEATLIAVVGASGGVGCSTAAAHLAARAPSEPVCLVDGDTDAGTIDVTAGLDHVLGPRWGDFGRLRGQADGEAIMAALPSGERYAVLAGGRGGASTEVVRSVVSGLRRACGLIVLDVGRLAVLPSRVLAPDDLVLVVTGVGVRHLAALDRIHEDLRELSAPVHLLTRGPKSLSHLGQVVSSHVDLPVIGHWADDPAVARDLERGVAPGARRRGLDALADAALALALPHLRRSA